MCHAWNREIAAFSLLDAYAIYEIRRIVLL
jgi:hypothetical protein